MIAVIGAFDGFHRGHALLFERARAMAGDAGTDWGVVTFEPHPGVFMGFMEETLFSARERELISCFLGVPRLEVFEFDEQLRALSPVGFWKYLKNKIAIDGIVVGTDFRFGAEQKGDVRLLEALCRDEALPFEVISILKFKGEKISSSSIRSSVARGDLVSAARELGYPWFLWGEVIRGNGRGRGLGFPTANIAMGSGRILPPNGVYSVLLPLRGTWRCGALSIGTNPTFDDVKGLRVEVFILDFHGDLYGKELPVLFLERLRPELRFESASLLVEQMARDVERCREVCEREMREKQRPLECFSACFEAMRRED